MEIIARLRIDGNENSVMIKDGDVTYPVFMESLHTADLFKNLMDSGYRLVGIPYDFKKDGTSIMSLPVKDYTPTYPELQDMFDLNSLAKMDAQELRKNISVDDVQYMPEPPCRYTITTREEFLEYLKNCQSIQNDDDFLPLNYFVHPSARFTMEEWRSGEYSEYFHIMESRRSMSYQKFIKLRDWLVSIGMDPMGDAVDIVDTYCSWGIDGLNVRFVNKQRKTLIIKEDFIMQPGMENDAYEITRQEDALIDRYGAIFPPEDVPAGYKGWIVAMQNGKESNFVTQLRNSLKEGEYGIIPVKTKSSEDVLVFNALRDTITVSPYLITSGKERTYNFAVRMPDVTQKPLSSLWWSAKYDQRVTEMSNLRALAYEMIKQRRCTAEVSTFKALMETGCDVKGALTYIIDQTVDKYGETFMDSDEKETVEEFPTTKEVDMYVSGEYDPDTLTGITQTRMEVIKDIVDGVVNLDRVQAGMKEDAAMDVDTIYRYLYCAHFCKTHVSIADIYKVIQNVKEHVVTVQKDGYEEEVIQLKSDMFTINVPCHEIRAKIDGYRYDLRNYRSKQATECCGFLKVVQIAKEYGDSSCTRHVAFEALTVNLHRGDSERNLERLMAIYDEQLNNVPVAKRAELRIYRRAMCMSEYFRVAEEGVMKFVKAMGGAIVQVQQDLVLSIRATIKPRITSTAMYCSKMYEDERFTHFCVNADITPWHVYPKGNAVIPAASLPALWYDWYGMGAPAIAQKLTTGGFIPSGFIPWTKRYFNQLYFSYEGMRKEMNLAQYMMYCNKFKDTTKCTEEFKHAPHLESLLYGMYPDETIREDSGVALRPEGQTPQVTVSVGEMVTSKTFPEHGQLDISTGTEDTHGIIQRFAGFTADDFDMLGDVRKVELPAVGEKYISVENNQISTESQDNLPAYAITTLVGMGYPVINLWGRKYVFRDLFGALWEVTI